jgi:hypothetical protein
MLLTVNVGHAVTASNGGELGLNFRAPAWTAPLGNVNSCDGVGQSDELWL